MLQISLPSLLVVAFYDIKNISITIPQPYGPQFRLHIGTPSAQSQEICSVSEAKNSIVNWEQKPSPC